MDRLFAGPGELRALCAELDWSSTPLGPSTEWPEALRTAVRLMLAAPVATSLWVGPDYTLIYNDAYRRILGIKHPGALGRSGAAVWDELWPELESQFEGVRAGGPSVYADEAQLVMERLEGGREDAAWFTYSLSALTDEEDRCLAVYNVAIEVTERVRAAAALRESEARYRSLFESIDEGFCVAEMIHDGDGRVVDYRFVEANPAFQLQTGLVHPVGRTVRELIPSHETHWFETYGAVARTGEPVRFEARSEPLDRWYDVYAFRIGPAGNHRIAMVFKDVSEARAAIAESERARAEAEDARVEAESASRAKSDFLAIMSHELRTPLNAIGGYADLMEMGIRGPVTPQQREDLRRIQTSQRHLLGLINEVLNYAKLETGTVHFQIADVPMREALTAAESLVAPQARAKGISLVVAECPPTLVARADPEKLRQILVNLLSNAVKFTDGGGRIEVTCEAAGAVVVTSVRDSGIGIPADRLDAIFEPFVQVRADLTRPHEGTGLGLAISRDLARGMHGDLSVESTLGAGSTFALTLPRG